MTVADEVLDDDMMLSIVNELFAEDDDDEVVEDGGTVRDDEDEAECGMIGVGACRILPGCGAAGTGTGYTGGPDGM